MKTEEFTFKGWSEEVLLLRPSRRCIDSIADVAGMTVAQVQNLIRQHIRRVHPDGK